MSDRPSVGYQNRLDFIRLLAMAFVFLFHLNPASPLQGFFSHLGDVGIILFVMLSGYGLSWSQGDKPVEVVGFVRRKLFRIFPSYWLSLGLIAGGLLLLTAKRPSGADWLWHVTGLHALWPGSPFAATISANLWFISLIVMLYLIFPWLHRLLWRASIGWGLALLLGSHLTLWLASSPGYPAAMLRSYGGIKYLSPFVLFNVLPFGLGMLLARMVAQQKRSLMPAVFLAGATCFLAIGLSDLAVGVTLFGLIVMLPDFPLVVGRWLKPLASVSYEFYLLHHALMGPLFWHWGKRTHDAPWWLFALVYAAAVWGLALAVQRVSSRWMTRLATGR